MELRLDRYQFTEKSTIGRMYVNGSFYCYTLEDKSRAGQKKVYGKTAIPEGKYKVVIYKSNKFNSHLPLLMDVKGFTGIFIHAGNSSAQTEGCILVGRTCKEDYVAYSDKAIGDLVKMINQAVKKENVSITIRSLAQKETAKGKPALA